MLAEKAGGWLSTQGCKFGKWLDPVRSVVWCLRAVGGGGLRGGGWGWLRVVGGGWGWLRVVGEWFGLAFAVWCVALAIGRLPSNPGQPAFSETPGPAS